MRVNGCPELMAKWPQEFNQNLEAHGGIVYSLAVQGHGLEPLGPQNSYSFQRELNLYGSKTLQGQEKTPITTANLKRKGRLI